MSGVLKEPFEIKVYEIDDVERLQRRRQEETSEVSRLGVDCGGASSRTCLDNVTSGSRSIESNWLSLGSILLGDTDVVNIQGVPQ